MTPITADRRLIGEKFKETLNELVTKGWIFEKGYEKLIVIAALAFSFFSLIKFIWDIL